MRRIMMVLDGFCVGEVGTGSVPVTLSADALVNGPVTAACAVTPDRLARIVARTRLRAICFDIEGSFAARVALGGG
jgi:hypothetical protein